MKHNNISIFIPHNGCPCKCSFCDQHRITGVQLQPSVDSVRKTITEAAEYLGERCRNTEIAFFGGSFTAIDRDYMVSLLELAHKAVREYGFIGIRCSTRPDKIDKDVLDILRSRSVSSIELGAQSMSDRVLTMNDRGHSSEDVRSASALIKSYGFELGLQMMTGLYGSSCADDIYTAEELIKLKPDTVRIYPTITLENTKLADLYRSGEYIPMDLDTAVDLCSELIEKFESNNISVIRVGLHSSPELMYDRVAGPFHPAFRELCMSRSIQKDILNKLNKCDRKAFVLRVNPKLLSAVVGQKRCNIRLLEDKGYRISLAQDKTIDSYVIE